jgi:hypothetical protein
MCAFFSIFVCHVFSHIFTIAPIQPQHKCLSSALFSPLQPLYYAILSQPECKPFGFDQTAVSAFTMQAPSKSASTHTTAHLFNKQQPGLHPTYTQQQPTNTTTNTHRLEDQLMDDDDDVSLSNVNAAHQSASLRDDNSVASEESFGFEESYGYNDFC